jgi:D-3-phosphoglycerate dehydrogenase / 2-oxoglutarate reductase
MAKVLVCDEMKDGPMNDMRAIPYLDVTYTPEVTKEDLPHAVKGFHAMVVRGRTKVTKEVIDAFDEMQVIIRGGVGVDNIDVAHAELKGVKVMNTPAASSVSVAELALAMMFALSRHIVPATNSMMAGQWEKKAFAGVELWHKTLGLVGLGRIARTLGVRCHALGMKVIGYDPYVDAADIKEFPCETGSLADVMGKADYISMHVPLTKETGKMIGAEMIGLMKPKAFLVDCSRGGVRDDAALATALKDGKIAGAGLDVFSKEPPESNPFEGMPNVILAPHVGAQTKEGQSRVGFEVVEILRDYFK